MKILALDQAVSVTGWAIYDSEIEFGNIKTSNNLKLLDKTVDMMEKIKNLILISNPDIVVLEDVTLQRNPKTMKTLAQLQGYIIGICNNKAKTYILSPTEWRKMLEFKQGNKIKRSDLKEQAKTYVKEHLNITNATEDECDAICILIAFKNNCKV